MPILPSYKNQSVGLHNKSMDWFLYESNTSICRVKLEMAEKILISNKKLQPLLL